MTERRSCTVIVVTYNAATEIGDCLDAVLASDADMQMSIVVVDNASTDDTAARARAAGVRVVVHQTNRGFAAAVNTGVAEQPADSYLVLNPDASVAPDAVQLLADALLPGVAAVGPALVSPSGTSADAGYYIRPPSLVQALAFYTRLATVATRSSRLQRMLLADPGLQTTGEVMQVPGGCMLIDAGALREIGAFDDEFHIWFEDVDWCYRARQAGYRLCYVPEARVVHVGGTSFQRWTSVDRDVVRIQSLLRFLDKHRHGARVAAAMFYVERIVRFCFTGNRDHLIFVSRLARRAGRLPGAA